jgi:hypothetical protein
MKTVTLYARNRWMTQSLYEGNGALTSHERKKRERALRMNRKRKQKRRAN